MKQTKWEMIELFVVGLLIVVAAAIILAFWRSDTARILGLWLAGAAALGLLSGYSTGVSETEGTTSEFLKLLSAGIIVPLVAGVAALLQRPQLTTERYAYEGELLTEKSIEVGSVSQQDPLLAPLSVLGSFLLAYGLATIIGIELGIRRRQKSGGTKVREEKSA